MSPTDAREWAIVYTHGARNALDAAERTTGLERELNLTSAQHLAGLALMMRLRAGAET